MSCAIQTFGTVIQPVVGSTSTSTTQAVYEYAGDGPDARALEPARRLGRRVRAERAERAERSPRRATTASAKLMACARVLGVEHAALREHDALGQRVELLGRRARELLAHAFGGLDRGVAHHQGDAARIGAEVDRRDVGVAGDAAHVERCRCPAPRRRSRRARRPSPGRSRSRRRTRSPARCGRAGAARPSAASCSSRSAGPRRTGRSRRRGRGRARRQLAVLVVPVRARDHRRGCTRPGRSCRSRSQLAVSVFGLATMFSRSSAGSMRELLGDLVELDLLAEARLRRAVAALGAAGRLVGEGAAGLEPVARHARRSRVCSAPV